MSQKEFNLKKFNEKLADLEKDIKDINQKIEQKRSELNELISKSYLLERIHEQALDCFESVTQEPKE